MVSLRKVAKGAGIATALSTALIAGHYIGFKNGIKTVADAQDRDVDDVTREVMVNERIGEVSLNDTSEFDR